jgi:hypothetical protein
MGWLVATHVAFRCTAIRCTKCGHGWLSGGYTVGILSYGEEEFKFKFGMLNLTTLRLD